MSWQRRGGRPADVLAAQRARIAGRVTDPERRAIAGATVCAHVASTDLPVSETRQPRCAVAGADGRYQIPGLLPARYEVSAAAAHYQPGAYDEGTRLFLELAMDEVRSDVDLVLEPGGVELRGRVKDIGGGVIGGALVDAHVHESWRGAVGVFAYTNDQGEFALWISPGLVSVSADAAGYAPATKYGVAPSQSLEILLVPESVLVGRVVQAGTHEPVEGALVADDAVDCCVFSGVDGRFRIDRLAPGRYKPYAEVAGASGVAGESVLLGLGQTSPEVVIEMHRRAALAGRVLIAPRDQPCADGAVSLRDDKRNQGAEGRTDRTGAVFVRALRPGTYAVSVRCAGYLPEGRYPEVVVADRDLENLVWRVRVGQSIRGLVVTEGGAPVVHATVVSQPKDAPFGTVEGMALDFTRADGRFALEGLRPGGYRIQVTAYGHPAPKQPLLAVLELVRNLEDLRIVLERGGAVEGRAADPEGAPVGGAHVLALGASAGETITRDDGGFRIDGLAPGEYRVMALGGAAAGPLLARGRDERPDIVRTLVQGGQVSSVRLTVEPRTGEIRGQVVDHRRQPVPDAFVDAEREPAGGGTDGDRALDIMRLGLGRAPVLTDLNGHFKLGKLAPGSYTVHAFRRGGGEAIAEHIKVGATVSLTILATGSIAGTVVATDGRAPEEFFIRIADDTTGFRDGAEFSGTGGRWVLPGVPPGNFEISTDQGLASTRVRLEPGQNLDHVRLVMAGRATVRGRLLSLDGTRPVPGMRIAIEPAAGRWDDERDHISDPDGRFEIENAPSGRVYIVATPVDYLDSEFDFTRVPATLRPGQVNELPPIRLSKRRHKVDDRLGELGYEVMEQPPDVEPTAMRWVVAQVRPDGPAAQSGLKVGDAIVSVDGQDVTGGNAYLYWSLEMPPVGSTVTLGLARGASVHITAGPRRDFPP